MGGTKAKRKTSRQKVRVGLGAPEQPAAAGSRSPHVTRHGADIVEIQNSRWLFGLFFFFSVSFPRQQDSLSSASCHSDFT